MTGQKSFSGSAKMRARARLISLLGDELISDEAVAVVELVKNAYDADANHVKVRFEGDNPSDPDTLIIEDDGDGMSLETVLNAWFEPGTVNKKGRDRTAQGRLLQGAKGIGRFAAARLGESLFMETRRAGHDDAVSVLLDWGSFTDESYLDEVEISYEVTRTSDIKKGTRLTLINLHARKHWLEDDYRNLHDRLSRLISPFSAESGEEVEDFQIELVIPSFPEFTGRISPHELTRTPTYRLQGAVNEMGNFSGELTVAGELAGVLKIEGEKSVRFEERPLGKKGEVPACGPFDIEIRAWDRDRPGLSPYMLKFDETLTRVRELITRYSGVSIYRDGFRVHPYGEQGNDWLSLDTRSRQTPTTRLANNQVIAAVGISRKTNPGLRDRTTREGLVHNAEYGALQDWFVRVLALLEEERYKIRPRVDAKPEEVTALFEAFDMTDVSREVSRQLGKQHPVSILVDEKEKEIRDSVKRLQEHYSRVMMAAGLGQMVDIVVHEVGAPLGRINREVARLERQIIPRFPDQSSEIRKKFESINAWLEQIAALRERLIPKAAGRRGKATSFSVQEEVLANLMLFETLLAKQKIRPNLRAPKTDIVVNMSRSSFGQIVANLIDNSIYWLTRHHGDGNGGQIDIHLETLEKGFSLTVCDDGPGVALEDRERIFEINISNKPSGMGLGLFIARQLIEPYGRLIYADDCSLAGACFVAKFEQRVGV